MGDALLAVGTLVSPLFAVSAVSLELAILVRLSLLLANLALLALTFALAILALALPFSPPSAQDL